MSRGRDSNPLKAIAEGRSGPAAELRHPPATNREAVELLFQALDVLHPPNPRLYKKDRVAHPEITVMRELAVVPIQSTTRLHADPFWNRSQTSVVLLKQSHGEWRFLWSPDVQTRVDSQWDAPKQMLAEVTLISDHETSVSISGVRTPRKFSAYRITLPAGDYEVVGTRAGFREVRWLLHVPADLHPVQISVVCSTKAE